VLEFIEKKGRKNVERGHQILQLVKMIPKNYKIQKKWIEREDIRFNKIDENRKNNQRPAVK
jgi:hypothetical protein